MIAHRPVAVCGFDDPKPVIDALESSSARAQVVSGGSLAAFDIAVIAAEAVGRFEDGGTPFLVVGPIGAVESGRAGNDFMIAPPLNADELLVRLCRLVAHHRSTRESEASEVPLVVTADDDPTTTAIVKAVVTQAGMRCQVAPNGKQALQLARDLLPDAIVLDVNMPFLDGFEVLSALRGDPRTAEIPVLMLTSVQQEPDVLRGFSLGADDYVAKPFNPMELLARVQRLVRRA